MRDVAVVGVGMVPFGKFADRTVAELAAPAVKDALSDAGVERSEIGAAYCGTSFSGTLAGQRILATVGLSGIPITNTENACSSGSTAFREAWIAVGSGVYDTALVIGVDKLTRLGGGALPLEPEDFESRNGLLLPALYAMRAARYLHEHGASVEDLAEVSVKSRAHGALNPFAQMRKNVSLEEVMASRPIAEPLTLFQCCPTGDGAAAAVITATDLARRYDGRAVRVLASELTSGRYTTGFRDMTTPEITVRGAAEAYEQAGLGPDDIDVAEVHDAFSIAELLYYAALGFCRPGDAVRMLKDGESSLGGRIPVNPSGGLLSKGHPVGATGVAQIAEIVWQLRGECGPRQVEGARVGLTHATGGGISGFDHGACAIHIFGT